MNSKGKNARQRATTPPSPVDLGPLVTASDYDWADQRAARAARAPTPDAGVNVTSTGPRLDRLNVTRESDGYDRELLDGGVRQSWARNSDAPHLDQIREAGLDPLYHPDRCPFDVVTIRAERFHAAFFVVGNVGWLYSPSSAKSTDSRGDNAFTATLSKLIAEYRPIILDSVSFARLVRSLEHGPTLGATCGQCVDLVLAGQHRLDFKQHREVAQLLWTLLTTMAAAERDEIQRMQTAGFLVKYNRGEWPIHLYHLPFGYLYREDRGRLEPDPTKRHDVEKMLSILVSGLPQTLQVEMLIDLGVLPGRPASSRTALRTLIRWAPLYVNGIWIQHYANPVPGLDEWMNLPVIRNTPDELGHFELVYRPGVPAGGWAPEPLLQAVLAMVRATQRIRQGGKRSRRSFAGYTWEAPIGARRGQRQWRIGVDHDQYDMRVRTRPHPHS